MYKVNLIHCYSFASFISEEWTSMSEIPERALLQTNIAVRAFSSMLKKHNCKNMFLAIHRITKKTMHIVIKMLKDTFLLKFCIIFYKRLVYIKSNKRDKESFYDLFQEILKFILSSIKSFLISINVICNEKKVTL